MQAIPPIKYGAVLVFLASVALAQAPNDNLKVRTLKVSEHPRQQTEAIYVAGQVVTTLVFEKEVDPAKTRLLAWEGRFACPLIGGTMVALYPLRDLDDGEFVPLQVTLVDGTEFAFLVKPKSREEWGWLDQQVNVFKDSTSYNAVLSSLYDSLKRERELSSENARLKKEETSVDHAYATLLLNRQERKTPFRREVVYRPKDQDMDVVVEVFSGPSKAAVLVHLTNTDYGEPWKFDGAYLTHDFSRYTARPFALRMDRATIVPGQSGKIAVVVDRSAFEKEGQLVDLALQIVRDDGLLQVLVHLEPTLLRK